MLFILEAMLVLFHSVHLASGHRCVLVLHPTQWTITTGVVLVKPVQKTDVVVTEKLFIPPVQKTTCATQSDEEGHPAC